MATGAGYLSGLLQSRTFDLGLAQKSPCIPYQSVHCRVILCNNDLLSHLKFNLTAGTGRGLCSSALKIYAKKRHPTRTESSKVRELRNRKKFNGTTERPRLSIFCSSKHLYAQLIDDSKKRSLAFASTLQESIRGNLPCNTTDAAQRVGEEMIKSCIKLRIKEVRIDRNGFARGERMAAFEIPLRKYGFIPYT